MEIFFHGADRGVTGSCHLLSCAGKQILIDCGMYQGGRELEEENSEPSVSIQKEIDFVLLTHAHLDHCGRLPLLAKRGFRGEIITTAATRELARLVMVDAAHLQEEEWNTGGTGLHITANISMLQPRFIQLWMPFWRWIFSVVSPLTGNLCSLRRAYASPSLMPATSLGRPAFFWNWKKTGGSAACCSPVISATAAARCCATLRLRQKLTLSSWKPPTVIACTSRYSHRWKNFTKRLLTPLNGVAM